MAAPVASDLGGPRGVGHLRRVTALDFAAPGTGPVAGDDPRDMRPAWWQVSKEPLDRLDVGERSATAGAAGERDFGLLIDLGGQGAIGAGMPRRAPRAFLAVLGDFGPFRAREGGGLARGSASGPVELLLKLLAILPELANGLLQGGDPGARRLVLLTQSLRGRRRLRSHDPPLW